LAAVLGGLDLVSVIAERMTACAGNLSTACGVTIKQWARWPIW
jgi:hypothetical protein